MSTSVPFSITHPLSNVRLLESSPEIISAIESGQHLTLKSLGPGTVHTATDSADGASLKKGLESSRGGFLYLCTKDKCWAIKQVSSSNSVFVTRPQTSKPEDDNGAMQLDEEQGAGGIAAFAKPTDVLELHAVPAGTYESTASELIRRFVPIYNDDSTMPDGAVSRRHIYENVPVPDTAIDASLAKACVFEVDGKCYAPNDAAKLNAWRKVVELCTINETSIDDLRNSDLQGIEESILRAIGMAILKSDGLLGVLNLRDEKNGVLMLNELETARWVGNLVLASDKIKVWRKDAFIAAWEDFVPASWMQHCSLEVLGGLCEVVTDDGHEAVRWRSYDVSGRSEAIGQSKAKSAAADGAGKRKWHEKFAAQRDSGR